MSTDAKAVKLKVLKNYTYSSLSTFSVYTKHSDTLLLSGCVLKRTESPHVFKNPKPNNSDDKFSFDYNWINQLSNTTVWWLDICCLLHRYQLHGSALMAIFRLIDWQQTCKQLYFGMRLVYGGEGVGVGWGYEISCVLSREGDVGAWVLMCRPRPAQ